MPYAKLLTPDPGRLFRSAGRFVLCWNRVIVSARGKIASWSSLGVYHASTPPAARILFYALADPSGRWLCAARHVAGFGGAYRFGAITDRALFYSKGDDYTFNRVTVDYSKEYIASKFTHRDDEGRRFRLADLNPPGGPVYEFNGVRQPWRITEDRMLRLDAEGRIYKDSKVAQLKRHLDEMPGQAVPDLWTDIPPINSQAKERLGYPTQKPLALLDRIIRASSNPGDVVCDLFCGCGPSIAAAENLGHRWIGIDITYAAIVAIQERFRRDRVDIWKDVEIVNRRRRSRTWMTGY